MTDTDLLAAIGRIVVEAAMLEYSVATLIAVTEGLQGEECEERAQAIAASPGKAMHRFGTLARKRDDLRWLKHDTQGLLQARHFVAHAVFQEDALAEGKAAIFVLSPKKGETMITLAHADDNARIIREGRVRIQAAIAAEISSRPPT
jgi:hypothetical protein